MNNSCVVSSQKVIYLTNLGAMFKFALRKPRKYF